jgi:hypothetical protein
MTNAALEAERTIRTKARQAGGLLDKLLVKGLQLRRQLGPSGAGHGGDQMTGDHFERLKLVNARQGKDLQV